jgi:excisionase family DNA binding protein
VAPSDDADTRRLFRAMGIAYDADEVRRLFREWDLEVVRDLLPDDLDAGMTRDELELLTIDQAAELWQVSKRTVERWVATGRVPSIVVGERGRRIRAVDAREIASSGTSGYVGCTSTERSPGAH